MPLRDDLHAELTAALRRRDPAVARALRTALAAIANAEALPAPPHAGAIDSAEGSEHIAGATAGLGATEAERIALTEEQQRALVAHEQAELSAHAERLTALCRRDEADGARRAAQVLGHALAHPKLLCTESTS